MPNTRTPGPWFYLFAALYVVALVLLAIAEPKCTCVFGNPDVYERHVADPSFTYDQPEDCAVHGAATE